MYKDPVEFRERSRRKKEENVL